jgi:hypothetical protein
MIVNAEPWHRVIEIWRRSGIQIRAGVSTDEIVAFEAKYDVVLPIAVREYFMIADGTGDDMDEGMYRFWPLAEMKPVHEELRVMKTPTAGHIRIVSFLPTTALVAGTTRCDWHVSQTNQRRCFGLPVAIPRASR